MDTRTLGTDSNGTALEVSAQGLGCMGMSAWYGATDEAESVATIRRAHAVHPITALQSEYSLWSRDPEAGALETCRELGIGFVAYSPLGRGFLAGRFSSPDELDDGDFRKGHPRFSGANFEQNRR